MLASDELQQLGVSLLLVVKGTVLGSLLVAGVSDEVQAAHLSAVRGEVVVHGKLSIATTFCLLPT